MKITPLEIRQKTFEKAFRGLDKEEVEGFLVTLSQEWEKLADENKELKIKLDSSEKEVAKLREVENSLFKTLKTAEDTGANMIDQATKTADLHMKEAQFNAEAILNDAKNKARDLIEEAEDKSQHIVGDMEAQIRAMAQIYRTLSNVKDDLLSDIKAFANEAIEKVERAKNQMKQFDVEGELLRMKRNVNERTSDIKAEVNQELSKKEEKSIEQSHPRTPVTPQQEEAKFVPAPKPQVSEDASESSFFDDID